jgi:hypothetical protein
MINTFTGSVQIEPAREEVHRTFFQHIAVYEAFFHDIVVCVVYARGYLRKAVLVPEGVRAYPIAVHDTPDSFGISAQLVENFCMFFFTLRR